MEKLARFLNDNAPSRILDVGTGSGNFIDTIISIYKGYSEIIGIDTIDAAIKSSTTNFKGNEKISFVKMDARNITYKAESFDLVCLSNSLHHLDDIKAVIKEMERVLKPGGHLLFAEMMSNNLSSRQKSHLMLHHFAAKLDRLEGHTHFDTYKDLEILEVCKMNSNLNLIDNWVLHYEGEKENSDSQIKWLLDTVDKLTSRVNNDEIFNEAKEIKGYIRKNGFDSCPTMMVVMEK